MNEQPTKHELETYKWRCYRDSLDPDHRESCSIDTHVAQMRDPKAWIQSFINLWQHDWLYNERLKAFGLTRKSTVEECLDMLENTITNLKPFLKHKTECRINRVVNGECDCGLNDILGE